MVLAKYFKILKKQSRNIKIIILIAVLLKRFNKSLYKSNNKIELKQFNCFGKLLTSKSWK